MAIAVVVSKCNIIINDQSCSANTGKHLRNSSTCTYSSGSSNCCRNSSNNKIHSVVVVNTFVCVAFELVE